MAIDVLKVLPKVGDVPLPNAGMGSQLGERLILEMIQRENSMAQINRRSALDDFGEAVKTMAADDFFSDVPYQKKMLAESQAKMGEYAKMIKDAGDKSDSVEIGKALLDYNTWKKTDPNIRTAMKEQAALKSFNDSIKGIREKIDPVAYEKLYQKINDPERNKPITDADLNVGSLVFDIEKVADDYLNSLTKEQKKYEYETVGNVVRKKLITTKEIDPNAEQMLSEFLKNKPGTAWYGDDLIKEVAKRKVGALKYQLYDKGGKSPIRQESEASSYYPTPGSNTTKATYGGKLVTKYNEGGIVGTMGDGLGTKATVMLGTDGNPRLFVNGADKGSLEDNWDDISDEFKKTMRDAGVDYDKYEVAGTGKRISGKFNVEMGTIGLSPSDRVYSKEIGAASKAQVKDGYIETNNPEVLSKLGYTLSYNKDLKRYQLTDANGKVYDETSGKAEEDNKRQNTGVFSTSGGASVSGDVDGVVERDEVYGTEKMFKVRVSPLTQRSSATGATGSYEPTGDVDEDTKMFIRHGESRGDGYKAVNPSDNNWVSIGQYQFNTEENQNTMFADAGKANEWNALKPKLKDMSASERKSKIDEIINSMTSDQYDKFMYRQDQLAKVKYFNPLAQQFKKDNIEVPSALNPLIRDMAIQHTGGMISSKEKVLYNKVKDIISKGGDEKEMAKEISDIRADYVKKLNLSSDIKDSILNNRIPDALAMTLKNIDKYKKPKSNNVPAPASSDTGIPPATKRDSSAVGKDTSSVGKVRMQ